MRIKRTKDGSNDLHSTSYEKYFEGYTEYRDPETGKIRRIYTEDFYRSALSDGELSRRRALYVVLCFLSFGIWLVISLRGSAALSGVPDALLSLCIAADTMGFLFEMIYLFFSCTAPRLMTAYKYREAAQGIKHASFFCMIALTATACIEFLGFLIRILQLPWITLFITLCYLVAAAASGAVWYLEAHTSYVRVPNPATVPESDENIVH